MPFTIVVGKGWTGGRPSVASVVMIEPVVTADSGMLLVCDCVLGTGVMVTGSDRLRCSSGLPRLSSRSRERVFRCLETSVYAAQYPCTSF